MEEKISSISTLLTAVYLKATSCSNGTRRTPGGPENSRSGNDQCSSNTETCLALPGYRPPLSAGVHSKTPRTAPNPYTLF